MAVTGSDITDDQINAVLSFEQELEQDPDPDIAAEAAGWVNICNKALAGNPKDRSKAAVKYNELVDAGSIQPM